MEKKMTLVTQYAGQKEPQFRTFVDYCIHKARKVLQARKVLPKFKFKAYTCDQVHGTLIGLEAVEENGKFYNQNYRTLIARTGGAPHPLDFDELVDFLQTRFKDPIRVRFGGWKLGGGYGFQTLAQEPYYRSFYLGTGEPTSGAIAGWPEDSTLLDKVRTDFQTVGIAEKWKAKENRQVIDLFCTLGHIKGSVNKFDEFKLADGAAQMRSFLAELDEEVQWVRERLGPVDVEVSERTLAVVRYTDRSLPLDSSEWVRVPDLTADKLRKLYAK